MALNVDDSVIVYNGITLTNGKDDTYMTATATAPSPDPKTPAGRLAIAIDANRPVLIMGAPGTAKTAMLERIAAERGAHLEIVIASAQDPTTILGIPMPSEDRKYTEPTTPGWARRINDAHAQGMPTILFLDELTTVPPMVAGPLLGVVQSRRADGWTIPAETRIVAAANPPDLAVGGWAIEPAMANRWVHIDWPAPTAEWTAWAGAQSSPALRSIAQYISSVPNELLQVPTSVAKRSGPWPSPRSWTNAAALIDASGDVSMAALAVGEAAAMTFARWYSTRDIPTVEQVLSGEAQLPERTDAFVATITALVDAANDDTLERTIAVLIAAVPRDAAAVSIATRRLAAAGHVAGIAPLATALTDAGIDLTSVAVQR